MEELCLTMCLFPAGLWQWTFLVRLSLNHCFLFPSSLLFAGFQFLSVLSSSPHRWAGFYVFPHIHHNLYDWQISSTLKVPWNNTLGIYVQSWSGVWAQKATALTQCVALPLGACFLWTQLTSVSACKGMADWQCWWSSVLRKSLLLISQVIFNWYISACPFLDLAGHKF